MITLTYGTISYTFPNLSDHPVGWEETETTRGRVARQWAISGVVTREDAKVISDMFRAWQAARIADGDPSETGIVGVTAGFTGEAPGFAWTTAVPVWFNGAPQIQMAGAFCRVSLSAGVQGNARQVGEAIRAGPQVDHGTAKGDGAKLQNILVLHLVFLLRQQDR